MNKINVLSLFDGLSGARIALDKLNIPCNYYSSEIDKYAIQVSKKNYPDIVQLGDVVKLGRELPYPQELIACTDLIVFGSPCQNLSVAKQNREGLKGEQSKLFFEAVRIIKDLKPKYFLMENVKSMSKENKQIITDILGVESACINSALVSAQNRKRLYWFGKLVGNKYETVEVTQPEDKGIYLKDILENGDSDKLKSYCIDANYWKGASFEHYLKKGVRQLVFNKPIRIGQIGKGGQGDRIYSTEGKSVNLSANGGGRGAKTGLYCVAQRGRYNKDGSTSQKLEPRNDGKTTTLTNVQKDNYVANKSNIRKLTPIECERLQTVPDNYTAIGINEKGEEVKISNTQRYKMIGNGFTVDVIMYILKGIFK